MFTPSLRIKDAIAVGDDRVLNPYVHLTPPPLSAPQTAIYATPNKVSPLHLSLLIVFLSLYSGCLAYNTKNISYRRKKTSSIYIMHGFSPPILLKHCVLTLIYMSAPSQPLVLYFDWRI